MWGKRKTSVIPGFGLSMGYAMVYLSLIVLIPFILLFIKAASGDWAAVWDVLSSKRVWSAFYVSLSTSLYAAFANAIIGLILAWTLVRYSFFGRKFLDALIDLPFALPTAVAGIALTTLYAKNGWIGSLFTPYTEGSIGVFFENTGINALLRQWDIKIAYAPLGISLALLFIGLPFVVRTLQPVLQDLETDVEEAAMTLGASSWRIFWRIIFPSILPAWLTGVTLSFARGIGEYGSVVFISGNIPFKTEIVPLLIVTQLEEYDYVAAAVIAVMMLLVSFGLLFLMNTLQWLARRRIQST